MHTVSATVHPAIARPSTVPRDKNPDSCQGFRATTKARPDSLQREKNLPDWVLKVGPPTGRDRSSRIPPLPLPRSAKFRHIHRAYAAFIGSRSDENKSRTASARSAFPRGFFIRAPNCRTLLFHGALLRQLVYGGKRYHSATRGAFNDLRPSPPCSAAAGCRSQTGIDIHGRPTGAIVLLERSLSPRPPARQQLHKLAIDAAPIDSPLSFGHRKASLPVCANVMHPRPEAQIADE